MLAAHSSPKVPLRQTDGILWGQASSQGPSTLGRGRLWAQVSPPGQLRAESSWERGTEAGALPGTEWALVPICSLRTGKMSPRAKGKDTGPKSTSRLSQGARGMLRPLGESISLPVSSTSGAPGDLCKPSGGWGQRTVRKGHKHQAHQASVLPLQAVQAAGGGRLNSFGIKKKKKRKIGLS